MADIKISELGAALTVGDSDVLPMTASGVTSKVSTSLIKDYVIGTTDISTIGDGTVTGAIDAINTDMPDGLDDLDDVSITTPADGEAPVYDSVSQKFKNTAIVTQDEFGGVIAPIEVSPSAHAYSVGKQLLYNNVLYTVTSPIAVSDALTEGTNITASDTVIEQVEDNASDISDLNDEFYDAWQKNGAYNLANCVANTEAKSGFTLTKVVDSNTGGVTYTITGTDSGSTGTQYIVADDAELLATMKHYAGTKVKLVGCPTGGDTTNGYFVALYFNYGAGDTLVTYNDIGNGVEVSVPATVNTARLAITLRHDANPSGKTFKPMITTDLNATYADYVPHAKTNGELTEDTLYSEPTVSGLTKTKITKVGKTVTMSFSSENPATLKGVTFPAELRPSYDIHGTVIYRDTATHNIHYIGMLDITSAGAVYMYYTPTYGSARTEITTNTTGIELVGTITYLTK